jgi:hypothetical protein
MCGRPGLHGHGPRPRGDTEQDPTFCPVPPWPVGAHASQRSGGGFSVALRAASRLRNAASGRGR